MIEEIPDHLNTEPAWVMKLRKVWWVNHIPKSVTLFVAVLAMCGTVFNSIENKTALYQNNRAWLGLIDERLENFGEDNILYIDFTFLNSGKSPAKITSVVVDRLNFFPIEPSQNANTIIRKQQVSPAMDVANRTCKKRANGDDDDNSDIAVFPNAVNRHREGFFPVPSIKVPDLLAGRLGFTTSGCLTYETEGTIRHTRFCVYTDGEPKKTLSELQLGICGKGNNAN